MAPGKIAFSPLSSYKCTVLSVWLKFNPFPLFISPYFLWLILSPLNLNASAKQVFLLLDNGAFSVCVCRTLGSRIKNMNKDSRQLISTNDSLHVIVQKIAAINNCKLTYCIPKNHTKLLALTCWKYNFWKSSQIAISSKTVKFV